MGKWITERTPEAEGTYLVTWYVELTNKRYIELLEYTFEDGWEKIEQATLPYKIIAWMDVPSPYCN